MINSLLGVLVRYLLFPGLMIFTFCGWAGGQAIPSLTPPAWAVGGWWTVQSQVYDEGKIMKGAKPGWRSAQTWRFQVEKIDHVANEPYYVVLVTPGQDNSCPYSFRYWFRVSDRFVGRRELLHSTPARTKPKKIGPKVVAGDFFNDPPTPYFADDFPSLPVTMPLFGVTEKTMAFGPAAAEEQISQKTEEIPLSTMMEKAGPELKARNGKNLAQGNLRTTLTKHAKVQENQYWNQGMPFPVYGERADQTRTSRRYWLVEAGQN